MGMLRWASLGQLWSDSRIKMANQKIFCNVPWTNVHIYWDGSFGACCSEKKKPYDTGDYNLKNMTVGEWFNSAPMKQLRHDMHGDMPLAMCAGCTYEEENGHESKRIRENFKTIIFTKDNFNKSMEQSPWKDRFDSALTNTNQEAPIDWHVDIGNECNLSCKMCRPEASSLIANKYRKWNIEFRDNKNWASHKPSWDNFISSITSARINRLHIMGGEPMISKKFKDLVDHLINSNNTGMSISFVTNGTVLDQDLIDKLKKFKSFDLEISIESITNNNHYIRQGIGDCTQSTLSHINSLLKQQSDTFHVVLRSVPQLLNINTYDQYIKWAWDSKVSIQSTPLIRPPYLSINVLPLAVRQRLIPNFIKVKEYINQSSNHTFKSLFVGRDTSRLHLQLISHCDTMISLLDQPEPLNIKELRAELAEWLMRWDKEFNLNAFDFYPEYTEFLNEIQYRV